MYLSMEIEDSDVKSIEIMWGAIDWIKDITDDCSFVYDCLSFSLNDDIIESNFDWSSLFLLIFSVKSFDVSVLFDFNEDINSLAAV